MTSVRKGYFQLAIQSLKVSRTRSLMTMLGIVIAVMSVVVISAVGQGVKEQVGRQVARYGKDVLLVRSSQAASSLGGNGLLAGNTAVLSDSDLVTVRAISGVQGTVPLAVVAGSAKGDFTVKRPLVIGTTPELTHVLKQKIPYGDFFTAADGTNAAVLGSGVARELFSDNAPLGQKFTFRGQQFTVAGVFDTFAAAPFSLEANYNQAIFIPYDGLRTMLGHSPQINQFFVKAKPDTNVPQLASSLQSSLNAAHGGADDTAVMLPGKGVGENQMLHLLTLMTVCMALVALVVGGVGIMNMMLVSVTERIHEIGVRKAIGATNQQILRQFVTEAFALCSVGAFIGFFGSLLAVMFMRLYTSLQPIMVWPVAIFAPVAALCIGVFFGAIPALKAAAMDPIEALRHE